MPPVGTSKANISNFQAYIVKYLIIFILFVTKVSKRYLSLQHYSRE